MKKTIQLTENELKRMVMESVKIIINETITPKYCTQCGNPLKQGDNFCSKCGANIQKMINSINAWRQKQQQGQQQPQNMQQQPQQQQPQQQTQQQSVNNDSVIDNQVQQQMQRNLALQQQMADRIRQGVTNKKK